MALRILPGCCTTPHEPPPTQPYAPNHTVEAWNGDTLAGANPPAHIGTYGRPVLLGADGLQSIQSVMSVGFRDIGSAARRFDE